MERVNGRYLDRPLRHGAGRGAYQLQRRLSVPDGGLRWAIESYLEDVVRLQVERTVVRHTAGASKYPTSYRESVKRVKADCS